MGSNKQGGNIALSLVVVLQHQGGCPFSDGITIVVSNKREYVITHYDLNNKESICLNNSFVAVVQFICGSS